MKYVVCWAIWYHLNNLENVKSTHGRLLRGYFSRFLNCANGAKCRNASHMKVPLKGTYTVLPDTSACCADLLSITRSNTFSYSFFATRWVEDKNVADMAIEIWHSIVKVAITLEKMLPRHRPKIDGQQTKVWQIN